MAITLDLKVDRFSNDGRIAYILDSTAWEIDGANIRSQIALVQWAYLYQLNSEEKALYSINNPIGTAEAQLYITQDGLYKIEAAAFYLYSTVLATDGQAVVGKTYYKDGEIVTITAATELMNPPLVEGDPEVGSGLYTYTYDVITDEKEAFLLGFTSTVIHKESTYNTKKTALKVLSEWSVTSDLEKKSVLLRLSNELIGQLEAICNGMTLQRYPAVVKAFAYLERLVANARVI